MLGLANSRLEEAHSHTFLRYSYWRFCRPPFVSVGYCDCIEAYSKLQSYHQDVESPARVALRVQSGIPPPLSS